MAVMPGAVLDPVFRNRLYNLGCCAPAHFGRLPQIAVLQMPHCDVQQLKGGLCIALCRRCKPLPFRIG